MGEKSRCSWCQGDPLLEDYHDTEWGIPAESDDELFERMSMQIFQAGLNWKMILTKRANFNTAFQGFRVEQVVQFGDGKLQELLNDAGIIRNRQKITAVLHNAMVIREIQKEFGSFGNYLDSLPAKLSELQAALRKRFKFMGPEVTRMFVFNIGKIPPPHEKNCWRYQEKTG